MKKDTEKEKKAIEEAKIKAKKRIEKMDNEMKMLMTKLSQPIEVHVRGGGCSIM